MNMTTFTTILLPWIVRLCGGVAAVAAIMWGLGKTERKSKRKNEQEQEH